MGMLAESGIVWVPWSAFSGECGGNPMTQREQCLVLRTDCRNFFQEPALKGGMVPASRAFREMPA
jgi:hypothetical protein